MSVFSYNLGAAVISRLIASGLGLFVVGLLTRQLGPAEYGYYSLIFAYLYIFSALADLGLYTILITESAAQPKQEQEIVGNIFALRLVVVVVLMGIGAGVAWFFPYPAIVKKGLLVIGLASVLSSLTQVLLGIFQRYLKIYWVSLVDIVTRLIQLILVLLGAKYSANLMTFIWIVAIVEVVHFGLIFGLAHRLVKFRPVFDFAYWRKTIHVALPIAVSLVFVLLYFKLDTVLLAAFRPAEEVGIYSVAYKVLEVVIFLPAAYIGLLMPLLAGVAKTARQDFQRLFAESFDRLAIFALPAMTYLALRAADVVRVVGGEDFSEAVPVLRILSVAIMLIFFGNLGGNAIVALGLQKKGVWIYLLGAVVNVGANLMLIPRFGYYATAWTTVGTELIITVALFWLIKKRAGVTVRFPVFLRAAGASLLLAIVLVGINPNFFFSILIALGYFPLLYLLKGFNREDIRALLALH